MSLAQTGMEYGRYMSYLAERQQVIASNIANADTPGYKTRDVNMPLDFTGALQDAQDAVIDAPGLETRNDGNNVSIDRESRLLSETDMKFNLATQMIKSELKELRSAIEEGRTS
ncbi:MAG TPA: flagellar basal body protein [Bryobacteraceae bacterium]|nr:flagellar basal body protein [Bryobacteraceae bacterium]